VFKAKNHNQERCAMSIIERLKAAREAFLGEEDPFWEE